MEFDWKTISIIVGIVISLIGTLWKFFKLIKKMLANDLNEYKKITSNRLDSLEAETEERQKERERQHQELNTLTAILDKRITTLEEEDHKAESRFTLREERMITRIDKVENRFDKLVDTVINYFSKKN